MYELAPSCISLLLPSQLSSKIDMNDSGAFSEVTLGVEGGRLPKGRWKIASSRAKREVAVVREEKIFGSLNSHDGASACPTGLVHRLPNTNAKKVLWAI